MVAVCQPLLNYYLILKSYILAVLASHRKRLALERARHSISATSPQHMLAVSFFMTFKSILTFNRYCSTLTDLFIIMRPSSLGGAAYCVALCLSVCLSVRLSVRPSRYKRHVAPPSELQ